METGDLSPSLTEGYPTDFPQYLHWYIQAFFRLSRSRATTFGGAFYIPMSELLAYARYLQLGEEETERFLDYLGALDEIYLEVINSDSKTPQSKKEESQQKFLNR